MLALMALVIAFIFFNSIESAAVSGGKSQQVLDAFQTAGFHISERLLRKLAHFAEYTVLGFVLLLTLSTFTERILAHLSVPLFFGLLVPVIDEFIQLFSPGRSSEVRDVLIDFSGSVTGILCACLLLCILRGIRRRRGRWH